MRSAADYARRQVGDALYVTMLPQPGPVRAPLLLRALPEGLGVGPAAAREALHTDPRFVVGEGRCDIKLRAEMDSGGFNAGMERLIEDFGYPLEASHVAAFFADATGRDTAYYEELIARLLQREDPFLDADGKLTPRSWVLIPEGDTEEDVLFYCDLDRDEALAALRPACADDSLRGATPLDTAVNVVRAAEVPIPNRLLGFFVYRLHTEEFDPCSLVSEMLREERVYCTPGLVWVSGDVRQEIEAELARLDGEAAAEQPSDSADIESILAEPLPPERAGYFLEDDDLELIYEIVHTATIPVSIGELLSEVLGLTLEDADFIPAAHSLRDLLHEDPGVTEVSATRFMGEAAVPGWVKETPEALIPIPGRAGEDVILQEEGLRPGLAEKIRDPYFEDVADDDVAVDDDAMTEDETFYPLSFPHRVAGTMKLRKMDAELFDIQAPAAPITLVDGDGKEWEAWANTKTGLLLGLRDLYAAMDLMPGALLAITPGEKRGQFSIEAAGEDEATAVSAERLDQLLEIAERADGSDTGLYELTREVMAAYADGLRFETIHAELNVIRRTTRLQLASLLSYYQCFRPKDSEGDGWAYAAEAVATGAIASKQKYVVG